MRSVSTTSNGWSNVVSYVATLLHEFGRESKTKSDASQDLSGIFEPVLGTRHSAGRLSFTPALFELPKVTREVVQGCGVTCIAEGATFGGHLEESGFPHCRRFNQLHR